MRPTSYALRTETLTFLFTDIEGSTALLERLGDATYSEVLADHHSLIRIGLSSHGAEIAALARKDVRCLEVEEARWGSVAKIPLPGGGAVGLYQPKHPLALVSN